MLCAGVTQLGRANYATRGTYFQAFTSLSTGLERLGKLCLILDHLVDKGAYPSEGYLKAYCHRVLQIYDACHELADKRSMKFEFGDRPKDAVHQAILGVLTRFAQGDRYANIATLVGSEKPSGDPISAWARTVDLPLFESKVSSGRKKKIMRNAGIMSDLTSHFTLVSHVADSGTPLTNVFDASAATGTYEATAPYRRLSTIQLIRHLVEILSTLEAAARGKGQLVPDFLEIFAVFYNADSYIKKRKTWS